MNLLLGLVGELTFGGLIEAMRQAEEISQVEFAKKLGISKQRLRDIENIKQSKPGTRTPWMGLLILPNVLGERRDSQRPSQPNG